MNAFPKKPKFPRLLLALAVAWPVLLGVGWIANQLRSAKAGEHMAGQHYDGRIKYFEERRIGRRRYGNAIRVAIVTTDSGREIMVHDPDGEFAGCDNLEDIGYRMEESAVRGVDFVYIRGSCPAP